MVKDNQQKLKEQVEKVFTMPKTQTDMNIDFGHGRTCQAIDNFTFLDGKENWSDLEGIARIISERTGKRGGKKSTETRYYISPAKPKVTGSAIRRHWDIENNFH